jgi:hypothetical protein
MLLPFVNEVSDYILILESRDVIPLLAADYYNLKSHNFTPTLAGRREFSMLSSLSSSIPPLSARSSSLTVLEIVVLTFQREN